MTRCRFDLKRSRSPPTTACTPTALVDVKHLDLPLTSPSTGSPLNSIRLDPDRPYTLGRSARRCHFVFADRRVGKQHCQILFDSVNQKLYIADGAFDSVRVSLNGVFVNGIRVRAGAGAELSDGDRVSLACPNQNSCRNPVRIGFVVNWIVFEDQFVENFSNPQVGNVYVSCPRGCKRVFASRTPSLVERASFLSSECRRILNCNDPVTYIPKCCRYCFSNDFVTSNVIGSPDNVCVDRTPVMGKDNAEVPFGTAVAADENPKTSSFNVVKNKVWSSNVGSQPGKNFYLNRLAFMDNCSSSQHSVISLPELLHPVKSISQLFIATFTSDILWFLSSCEIPRHLPVTVACHNTERCWSSSPDKRTSSPYPDFPNLVLVYPPFPEAIAFGKDRERLGIACHHPKLFVVKRDGSIRVIITSANLVSTQWNAVTNTVWWQDFPHRSAPDYSALFTQLNDKETNQDSKTDFASQLAGFMASLLTDVPSQAQWIVELAKYDFGRATGHLITSVPGVHSYKTAYILESRNFGHADHSASVSFGAKFLGSVEASVVGLSYLFHNAKDSNGAKLKKLASFLRKSCENAKALSIVLTRNTNVPADANAVNVLVPDSNGFYEGDCVQLGFLPRNVAKWVSPLWDIGFFSFSGYICPKEALAAALGGNNKKVQLILQVAQGPKFEDISKIMQSEHVNALCCLITAIQRCTGLWRLQEVLGQYRWPESLDSDFDYGASSIGSINAKFVAAFSAAAGKRSVEFESEESDPEWGCWSASQESKSPSIRILFPTIKRVKNACNGIFPSKRILCFSEKTWQRLRTLDILHDAVPHPHERVGHPMHIKVVRRRFHSRTDASSSGWVYCGSHNLSAAAWGRPISSPFGLNMNGLGKANSCLGQMLHICNYELGIIFTFPPKETDGTANKSRTNLDDIVLPYVVPAPKYGPGDRPATRKAMWEALAEFTEQERERLIEEAAAEEIMEENPDEDEVDKATDYVVEEKDEEKAYAEKLWSQVDSSQSS